MCGVNPGSFLFYGTLSIAGSPVRQQAVQTRTSMLKIQLHFCRRNILCCEYSL